MSPFTTAIMSRVPNNVLITTSTRCYRKSQQFGGVIYDLCLFQGRGERAYDIYSRLLRERIICVMGPVSVHLNVRLD